MPFAREYLKGRERESIRTKEDRVDDETHRQEVFSCSFLCRNDVDGPRVLLPTLSIHAALVFFLPTCCQRPVAMR